MKLNKIFVLFVLGLLLIGALFFWLVKQEERGQTARPSLKVLTYSSFAGAFGPGRVIKKKFEMFCSCRLIWFLAEDSTALEKNFDLIPGIDMVIGWDQISLLSASGEKWENLSLLKKALPRGSGRRQAPVDSAFSNNPYFLPLDWSPVGFLYRNPAFNIRSLKNLPEIKGKISFPEPRASSLGMNFYYWIYTVFKGDKKRIAGFLQKLKPKIRGPVFSWSLAYGLFQKGRTDMGLSYLSSLLYHYSEEPNRKSVFFARFVEGHPFQVEFLSVSLHSKNKGIALALAKFLLSPGIQEHIRQTHYMFPVMEAQGFPDLEGMRLIPSQKMKEFIRQKKDLLDLWEEVLH